MSLPNSYLRMVPDRSAAQIGSGTAHTGYQMRRALDRQAEAVWSVLRDESSPHL